MSVLAEHARPLSRKRLYRLCRESLAEQGDSAPAEFEEAVEIALATGVLSESRPGVIGIPRRAGGASAASRSRKDERVRRKRVSRQAKALAGFPAAPISLEETAAMSVQASDRTQLSDALWKRLHRKASEVVGLEPRGTLEFHSDDESFGTLLDSFTGDSFDDASQSVGVESAHLPGAGLPGHQRTLLASAGEEEARLSEEKVGQTELIGPFRNRVRPDRAPYRERRKRSASYSGRDRRRTSRVAHVDVCDGTPAAAQGVLRRVGDRLEIEQLEAELAGGPTTIGPLRATLTADNERRTQKGQRPFFFFDADGHVGLTEWDFPPRYEVLEQRVVETIHEQGELVRRAILQRVGELDAGAFAQLMVRLVGRLGFEGFEHISMNSDEDVVLRARRIGGLDAGRMAIIARHSWQPIDADDVEGLLSRLAELEAASGVFFTIGTFTGRAVDISAGCTETPVRLVDGQGLAELLYENDLGVKAHHVPARYLDGRFFEDLAE